MAWAERLLHGEVSVKNKFFTDKFICLADIVPAQCVKDTHKSLQVVEKVWLLKWKS